MSHCRYELSGQPQLLRMEAAPGCCGQGVEPRAGEVQFLSGLGPGFPVCERAALSAAPQPC